MEKLTSTVISFPDAPNEVAVHIINGGERTKQHMEMAFSHLFSPQGPVAEPVQGHMTRLCS